MSQSSQNQAIVVLVPSSDARADIPRIAKENSVGSWPWPVLTMYGGPDWRTRTLEQIDRLPAQYKFILLQVDDVVITARIDKAKANLAAELAQRFDMDCLRLTPVARNAVARLLVPRCEGFYHELAKDEPYYSSWLIAIWKREHLRALVEISDDVYQFEHWRPPVPHYAVTEPWLKYECIVGKGEWYGWANKKYKLPATRPVQSLRQTLRTAISNLSFALLGFTSFRIKRAIRDWLRSRQRSFVTTWQSQQVDAIQAYEAYYRQAHNEDHDLV